MRFMIIRKADQDTETGAMPSEQLLADMGQYNEELVKAGVMRAGEGLHPSSKGVRVKFSKGKPTVIDGPFAETKELIAGFTMIDVKSMDEALEWVKRWPATDANGEVELEIRRVFEAEDFGAEFTPELREAEERMREQIAQAGVQPGTPASTGAKAIPEGYGATPYLTVKGADKATEFYKQVFGAVEVTRLVDPSGNIMHAELKVGRAPIMLSEESLAWGARSPTTIGDSASTVVLYVEDVDAIFAKATAAGVKVAMPVQNMFWGDRSASIVDPFGHKWMISTHIEDVSPDEMAKRAAAMFAANPGNSCS